MRRAKNICSQKCQNAGSHMSEKVERAKGIEPSYAAWEADLQATIPRAFLTYLRFVRPLIAFRNFELSECLPGTLRFAALVFLAITALAFAIAVAPRCSPDERSLTIGGMLIAGCSR